MPAVISPNILPQVGNNVPIFYTYYDVNNKLQQAQITNLILLYGSANIASNVITPTASGRLAIATVALVNGVDETSIIYLNVLNQNKLPNNRKLLTQKFPKGTFKML